MNNAKTKRNWLIGAALLLVIVLCLILFIQQYRRLGQTIEEERSTYISEIKTSW